MSSTVDRCAKCGGELVLDRGSVLDAEHFGYLGGRVHCVAGCTSVWLTKHKPIVERPLDAPTAPMTREPHEVRCRRCENTFLAKAPNAMYCFPCGVTRDRARAREHSRRRYAVA